MGVTADSEVVSILCTRDRGLGHRTWHKAFPSAVDFVVMSRQVILPHGSGRFSRGANVGEAATCLLCGSLSVACENPPAVPRLLHTIRIRKVGNLISAAVSHSWIIANYLPYVTQSKEMLHPINLVFLSGIYSKENYIRTNHVS